MRHRVGAAGHGHGLLEVLAPSSTSHDPSRDAARCQRPRQRRSDHEIALGGVTVGQVDDRLRPPQHVGHLGADEFGEDRREGQPDRQGRIADRLDQRHLFGCQPRRLCSAATHRVLHDQPAHADGQRCLVPGRGAQLPQLLKAGPASARMDPPGHAAQQCCGVRCASRSGPRRRREAHPRPGAPAPNSARPQRYHG